MKFITKKMNHKRGCTYCAETKTIVVKRQKRTFCKHKSCPFHELDEYDSYIDYLEANPSMDITKLLQEK